MQTLFPFFLIIGILLLIFWKFLVVPSLYHAAEEPYCPTFVGNADKLSHETLPYIVQPGDTCYEIVKEKQCDWGYVVAPSFPVLMLMVIVQFICYP